MNKKEKEKYVLIWNKEVSKQQTKEFWEAWSKLTNIPLKIVFGPKYCLLHAWLESF